MSLIRRYWLWAIPVLLSFIFQLLPNLFSSWLEENFGQTSIRLIGIISFLAITAAILMAISNAVNQKRNWVLVPREQQPPRYPGLILLVGPGRPDRDPLQGSAAPAIEYHLAGKGKNQLRVCWLVTSREGVPVAEALRSRYESAKVKVHVREIQAPFKIQDTYDLVRSIYLNEAHRQKIKPGQILSDFTGGTHPMAAGMVLACQGKYPMQYMSGKPDTSSQPLYVQFEPDEE